MSIRKRYRNWPPLGEINSRFIEGRKMLANDELMLLIKSKYTVIFVESIDEEYVVNQLRQITSQLGFFKRSWMNILKPHL
jgi:hypothetical protein